jgi:uncharacterized delta-60 repeat protein
MWLFSSRKKRSAKPARRSLSYRPHLEALEDRCLPSGAGSLDTTFGSGGLVTTNFGKNTGATAYSVARQPDGKIIAAGAGSVSSGSRNGIGHYFAIARYNTNGTLDTSFGPDHSGKVFAKYDSSSIGQPGWGFVLQPDGRIIVGANPFGSSTYELVRYNNNGTLDTTFGPSHNGTLMTTFAGATSTTIDALAIETVGGSSKIVAGVRWNYSSAFYAFALARYNLDGSLDSTFGNGGEVVSPTFPRAQGADVDSMVIQADGKVVLGGIGAGQLILARYDTSGNLDATFGSGGLVALPNGAARIVAIQSDGKIVAGGTENGSYGLVRFNVGVAGQLDGSLDATFGVGGFANTGSFPSGLVIQTNGKIVTVDGSVHRYNSDGSVDTGFGNAGVAAMPASSYAYGLALQTDGKIVAAGSSPGTQQTGGGFGVARFLGDPIPVIGSFTASPNPVTSGSNETLTVSNITDGNAGSSITQVAFYLDSNGDGILEPGTDTLVGYGTQTSPGVWTYTFTLTQASGSYTLFAQAEDNNSLFSDPSALTLTVQ